MPDIKQVDESFVRKYESEVHVAYQNKGGELRQTGRLVTGVIGESTTFQKVGTGAAVQKTRKGKLPIMNIDHSNVVCLIEDWHAPDFIDKFDQLKINHDERKVIVDSGAYALGRKSNEMIITQLGLTTNVVGDYSTAFTKALASKALRGMNLRKVPDDGMRFAALSSGSWEHFINIPEVKSADYAGELYPWLKGTEAIYWRKCVWQQIGDLPGDGTTQCKNYLWHKTAIGIAEAEGVTTDAAWEATYHSWFVNNSLSMGAILIDTDGVTEFRVNDTVDVT
ncbi:MAG: phage capsid protein [Alphaproteobacteria bacterium]